MALVDPPATRDAAAEALFAGPGEMRARCRALDWSATPLGAVDDWPLSLRTVVGMVMASPQAMWIGWGTDLVQVYNDAYTRLTDRAPRSLGRAAFETWADAWHLIGPEMESVRDGGPALLQKDRLIAFRVGDAVEEMYWTYSYSPIADAAAPHGVGGVLCFAAETTARVRTEAAHRESAERQIFLLELSDALRPLSDPANIQETAARILGEHLGIAWTYYGELDSSAVQMIVRRCYARGVPSLVGSCPIDSSTIRRKLEAGEVVAINDLTTDPLVVDGTRAQFDRVGMRAFAAIPLIKNDTPFAMIVVADTKPRNWTSVELDLIAAVGERTWSATQQARSEGVLRDSEERQAFLLKLSDALRPISDPVAIQATATRLLGEHLRANRVCYVEMSETESVVHQDYVSGVMSIAGRWRNADFGKAMEQALRTGRINVVSDMRALPGLSDAERASYKAIDVAAQIVVTLFKEGSWIANFGVHSASPREWTTLEVQLTEETAERTWASVERARAEVALRESEAKYRSLFETMSQGYFEAEVIRDGDGRAVDYQLTLLNPAHERLTGIAAADALGRTAREIAPRLEHHWIELADVVVRTGEPVSVEYEATPFDRWYQVQLYPGGGDKFTGFFDDVTTRKRAEIILRESEKRQAFLLTLSDDFRAHPGEDAVGRTCVHALAAHLGVERCYISELSSELNRGLVGPEYCDPALAPIAGEHRSSQYPHAMRDLQNGEPFLTSDVDTDVRLSDTDKASIGGGLGLQAMISAAPYQSAGKSIWALTVGSVKRRAWSDEELQLVRDVTERTWTAIERARTQRLAGEEAERLIAARTSERDALRRYLAQAEEAERQRLSRELHDQLGQQLTAFRLGLEDAGRLAAEHHDGRRSADGPLSARIRELQTLADTMVRGARYIALELRPPELDDVGLASALETYVREWADRYGISAEVTVVPSPAEQGTFGDGMPQVVASALYRIAQEALTNVAKHAKATQVSIVIDVRDSEVRLIMEDNGRGFDVDEVRTRARHDRRLGLGGMEERAALVGGKLIIESTPDSGTTLHVRLPFSN